MRFTRLFSATLLAGGLALGGSPPDDPAKTNSPRILGPDANKSMAPILTAAPVEPVEKDDTTFVTLPGSVTPEPAPPVAPADLTRIPGPPPLPPTPAPDPERPVLRRGTPPYPAEYGKESAVFCQKQIGIWAQGDAIELLGEPKRRRPSLNDEGTESGDILAFTDPSSRYREIELDFDRETGMLRTVFAYPWKLSWQECRKIWGSKVSAADADKGRMFYSYVDRRLDVLVDPGGNVISLGLY